MDTCRRRRCSSLSFLVAHRAEFNVCVCSMRRRRSTILGQNGSRSCSRGCGCVPPPPVSQNVFLSLCSDVSTVTCRV